MGAVMGGTQDCTPQEGHLTHRGWGNTREGLLEEGKLVLTPAGVGQVALIVCAWCLVEGGGSHPASGNSSSSPCSMPVADENDSSSNSNGPFEF